MATGNDIVRFADFPRARDRAADAHDRMIAAGIDDGTCDREVTNVELAPATSLRGVRAKVGRLQTLLSGLADGDTLTDDGVATVLSLCAGIDQALARFTARAAS